MTMLITKFHKLIQNRLVWIVFLVMVIISFVFWGMQTPDQDEYNQQISVATLEGKPVAPEEFQLAKESTFIQAVLDAGQALRWSSEVDRQLTPIAWRRLIALRKAGELGLVAGKSEVMAALQKNFAQDSRFDFQVYTNFVGSVLSAAVQRNLTPARFEHHVGEEMLLLKLQQLVVQSTLVSPYEVQQTYHEIFDSLDVDYMIIRADEFTDEIEVTEEDAQAFFEENQEKFELPNQVVVKYIKLDLSDYVNADAVTDDQIKSYYTNNLAAFEIIATNATPEAFPDLTNLVTGSITDGDLDEDAGGAIENAPLEDVRDEIRKDLERNVALLAAVNRANDMVYRLPSDRYGNAPSFEEAAAALSMEVLEAGPFSADGEIPGILTGAEEFRQQAFRLFPNPDEYFSNPIPLEDAVYVMALKEQISPRIPQYFEVRDQVLPEAERKQSQDAVLAKAREVYEAVLASAASTNAMRQVAESMGLTLESTGPFNRREGLQELPFAQPLVEAVADRNEGEVSSPIPMAEGMMIAYVRERTPADLGALNAVQDELSGELRGQLSGFLFSEWQKQLLVDAEFVERDAQALEDVEEEPGEESGEADAASS
jgi:hypothetical protein